MATLKFPCATCNKLMAVGQELAGKKVRCPHCQGVVVAPAVAAPVPVEAEIQFNLAERDEVDSIFGQAVADDDLFGGTQKPAVVLPPPAVAPAIFEAADDNPFGGNFSTAPADVPEPEPKAERGERPARRSRPTESSGNRNTVMALSILGPYAVFMTIVAIYYYMKFEGAKTTHPLEMIPDLLGEFKNKQSKGSSAQSMRLPPPNVELPSYLTTSLGQPITVGAIEVTPLSITQEPPVAFEKEKGKDEPQKVVGKTDHLVLHVRLRNVSPDLTFYPSDRYFDRRPKSSNDRPYVLVEVGKDKFYGGLIEYAVEGGRVERTWSAGQENDHLPLKPGESRTTTFVTHPKDGVIAAVKGAKSPALWRIQVRRGTVPYRDTEVPVSCVVGVNFTANDVKKGA